MTFQVTATSHTLADYGARGGYAALEKALRRMTPRAGDQGSDGLGHPGPRRRRLPGRPQVGRHQAQRRPAALPVRQRRRRRARHLQGPLDPRERAAPAARIDADRGLRAAGAPRLHLHPRRVRPALPAPRRGGGRGVRRRLVRRAHLRHRLPLRPRRLPRRRLLRVRRGLGRCSPRSKASAATRATARRASPCAASTSGPRWSTTSRRWPTSPGSSRTAPRPSGRSAPPRARARSWSRSPATCTARRLRGRVRLPAAPSSSSTTAAACSAAQASSAIIPGGISTKVLTGEEIEPLTLDHPASPRPGSAMGSGGMIVIAEGTCMVRLLQVMLRFYHHESCGQCTPCREGMGWMHRIIDRIVAGEGCPRTSTQLVRRSPAPTTARRSAAWATPPATPRSASSTKFRDEFEYCIAHKRSRCDGRLEVRSSCPCLRSS